MPIHRDPAIDLSPLSGRRITILGYGNQGRAHALNLRDGGHDVGIGARPGGGGWRQAEADGFAPLPPRAAAEASGVLMLAAPDEHHAALYREVLADALPEGATLAFAHGLAVHYGLIAPRADLDVILVSPSGPGHQLRTRYAAGGGLPCLAAVAQDASGRAMATALAYASALGAGRAGVIETTVREEVETDLFGEQAVLCGGMPELVLAGYDTLVEAGYPEELAYLECVHQVKLIADLIHDRGMAGMRAAISTTAEAGGYATGKRLIDDGVRARMRAVLDDVRSGAFVRRFVADVDAGGPAMATARAAAARHPVDGVAARMRALAAGLDGDGPAA